MTDNLIHLAALRRLKGPVEAPDAPHIRGDNFSPADSDVLEALGLGRGIPHSDKLQALRELRDWHDYCSAVLTRFIGDDGGGEAA